MSTSLALLIFAILSPIFIFIQMMLGFPVAVTGLAIPITQIFQLVASSGVIFATYTLVVFSYLRKCARMSGMVLLLLIVSTGLLGVFGLGQGVHFAANSLSYFIITNRIVGELRAITDFYDEKLSHLIWLPSGILFPATFAAWELVWSPGTGGSLAAQKSNIMVTADHGRPEPNHRSNHRGWGQGLDQEKKWWWAVGGLGSWYGVLIGLASLEAQLAKPIALPLAITSLLVLGMLTVINKRTIFTPGWTFALASNSWLILTVTGWYLRFRGFPEPIGVLF